MLHILVGKKFIMDFNLVVMRTTREQKDVGVGIFLDTRSILLSFSLLGTIVHR